MTTKERPLDAPHVCRSVCDCGRDVSRRGLSHRGPWCGGWRVRDWVSAGHGGGGRARGVGLPDEGDPRYGVRGDRAARHRLRGGERRVGGRGLLRGARGHQLTEPMVLVSYKLLKEYRTLKASEELF